MSKIEWTDYTLNPIIGCSLISIGCQRCYAKTRARLLANNPKISEKVREGYKKVKNWDSTVHYMGRDWFEERVKKIPAGSRVFVCSMGDLFHENVKAEWIEEIFEVMVANPQLMFQLLTKRSKRLLDFWREWWLSTGIYLNNIWIGTTAENQELYNKRGVGLLNCLDFPIRYVSCEPLLGAIDLQEIFKTLYNGGGCQSIMSGYTRYPRIDWVIIGSETGQGWRYGCEHDGSYESWAKPMILWLRWARSIRDQCKAANIPFFFKKPPGGGKIGEDGFTVNTPEDLKIREFPK